MGIDNKKLADSMRIATSFLLAHLQPQVQKR